MRTVIEKIVIKITNNYKKNFCYFYKIWNFYLKMVETLCLDQNAIYLISWKDIIENQEKERKILSDRDSENLQKLYHRQREDLIQYNLKNLQQDFNNKDHTPEKQKLVLKKRAEEKFLLLKEKVKEYSDEMEAQKIWLKKLLEFQNEELSSFLKQEMLKKEQEIKSFRRETESKSKLLSYLPFFYKQTHLDSANPKLPLLKKKKHKKTDGQE